MEITLMAVGRTTIGYVREGIAEYAGRLKHYVPFTFVEIPDLRNTRSLSEDRQKEEEGKLILSRLQASDYVVLLDERGKEFSSVEFSDFLQKQMLSGRKRLVFIIGGPYGFSADVYSRGDYKLSLSKMTFNHEMVRLFFTEQIYRAFTILRGEPYHHS